MVLKQGIIGGLPGTTYTLSARTTRSSITENAYLSYTTDSMMLYVDSTNGDDTNGDGSEELPFATIPRAYYEIPYWIRHQVALRIKAGIYTEFPDTIQHIFDRGTGKLFSPAADHGSLTIEGIDPPTIYAGPYTISAINTNETNGDVVSMELEVDGETWTVDELHDKFVHITSGDCENDYRPIYRNSTTGIKVVGAFYNPTVGDTFTIVEPSVTVNVSHGTTFFTQGVASNLFTNFSMANIRLNMTDDTDYTMAWVFAGGGYKNLKCVTLCAPLFNTFTYTGGAINLAYEQDSSIWVNTEFGHESRLYGFHVLVNNGVPPTSLLLGASLTLNNSDIGEGCIKGMCTRGEIWVVSWRGTMFNLMAEYIEIDHVSKCSIDRGEINQLIAGQDKAIRVDDFSVLETCDVYFSKANTNCILITDGSGIILTKTDCDTANVPGYGCKVGKLSTVNMGITTSQLNGTSGDVYFTQTASGVSYPAAGAAVTDGCGSFVTH
jgi:hypothetical protein